MRATMAAVPNTSTMPRTTRRAAHCQPMANSRNTITAGFRAGLARKKVAAAAVEAPLLRRPVTTGAAQQLHIMPGRAKTPPSTELRNFELPRTRSTQSLGTSVSSVAPSNRPTTSACQMARK